MTLPRVRLAAAGLLFVLWVCWLAYLAATTADPIVVSRPQLFSAQLIVEAHVPTIHGPSQAVEIVQVYRGRELLHLGAGAAAKVTITGLDRARGWAAPGNYLLALRKADPKLDTIYEVVPVPVGSAPPVIYPATDSTRSQVRRALRLGMAG